ncbi:MAG: hypothetical protein WBF42_12390 [Terracidiphilus sp.]|jgi:hypothetical protein
MKTQMTAAFLAILGGAMAVNQVQAQNTYLYVAHGAPGHVISSTTNPAYPVDFSENGVCVATGMTFGEIRGPFASPGGTFNVKFTVANAAAPCTGASVFTASVGLNSGTVYMGVLTFDTSKTVIGEIYPLDVKPTLAGYGRIEVVNSGGTALGAKLSGAGPYPLPGESIQEFTPPAGLYNAEIVNASNNQILYGPANVEIGQGSSYIYVVAGWASNQTLMGPAVIHGLF